MSTKKIRLPDDVLSGQKKLTKRVRRRKLTERTHPETRLPPEPPASAAARREAIEESARAMLETIIAKYRCWAAGWFYILEGRVHCLLDMPEMPYEDYPTMVKLLQNRLSTLLQERNKPKGETDEPT